MSSGVSMGCVLLESPTSGQGESEDNSSVKIDGINPFSKGHSFPSCHALSVALQASTGPGLKSADSPRSSEALAGCRHVALFFSKSGSLEYNGKNDSAFSD